MKRAKFNPVTAKRTPWFPADIKPARPGRYETRFIGWGPKGKDTQWTGESTWNGSQWSEQGGSMMFGVFSRQDKEWRGLAEDPKAAA